MEIVVVSASDHCNLDFLSEPQCSVDVMVGHVVGSGVDNRRVRKAVSLSMAEDAQYPASCSRMSL